MSSPTNPYGYPPNPEQPGQPGQPPYPQQPYPAYPTYPSMPDQPYGTPPAGYPYPPQGYPAYQQGGMPPFAPPAPPQRQRNTTLWVVLSIVGVLAVVACVGCGIFAFGIGNLVQKVGGPAIVTGQFCAELQAANYSTAYDRLSSGLQAQVTRDAFVSALQQRDSTDGSITQCSVQSNNGSGVRLGDTTAALPLTVERTSTTVTGSIQLVKEGTTWKISGIDPSLHLLP